MGMYGSGDSPIIETLIDGVWTDVSTRVRGEQKCVVNRGRSGEQARAQAQRLNLTFDNADSFFSTKSPQSVNFGRIGKNTQIRVRAGSGDNYLQLPYNDPVAVIDARTPDKAVLDITGDIDVRIEVWPHTWRPAQEMTLASKWSATSNQRSWILLLTPEGRLRWLWSSSGSGVTGISQSNVIPATTGRIALRLTFDVDNGSGGRTASFFTGPSISGPWTAAGTGSNTPTTSLFNSSAGLAMGNVLTDNPAGFATMGFGGKAYAFELRNGIAGTLVAQASFSSRSIGDMSWSDGLGTPNTWTISGNGARITSDRVRFWGELATLRPDWDKTGRDVIMVAQGAGLLRRLSQGAKPLESTMTRSFRQYNPYAWWTLEDGSQATVASSAISNGRAAQTTAVRLGDSTSAVPGASSTLSFTDATSRLVGTVPVVPANTGVTSAVFYVKVGALPASEKLIASLTTNGTVRRIDISIAPTSWLARFYALDGSLLETSNVGFGTGTNPSLNWVGYSLRLTQNGTAIDYRIRWDPVGGIGLNGNGSIASASVRPFTSITLQSANDAVYNDARFSHIFFATQDVTQNTISEQSASNAYFGENAVNRMIRLGTEENVPVEITGLASQSQPMGYQTTKTLLDLFYECWDADGGIGGEPRDALALSYRTRTDLERRSDCVLNYDTSDLSQIPKPADDDQGLINDFTANRTNGGSAVAVVEEGANSIQAPPLGVGRYDSSGTFNVSSDNSLPSIAGWIALVGSWDEDRYPQIAVALHRARLTGDEALASQVRALDLGDTVTLRDLPDWMRPDDVPEIVQGYSETLGKFLWEVFFTGTPAGPYQAVPRLGDDTYVTRLDGTTHALGDDTGPTDTSILIDTPAGQALWASTAFFPAEFPFNIVIGGEVMTVNSVTGASSPQVFGVTRSVNGIIKSHLEGDLVRLAQPFYLGR